MWKAVYVRDATWNTKRPWNSLGLIEGKMSKRMIKSNILITMNWE